MAKHENVRELGDQELIERLAQHKDEMFKLRIQHATGQLENTSRLGQLRTAIARCNTELREREIAAADVLAGQEQ